MQPAWAGFVIAGARSTTVTTHFSLSPVWIRFEHLCFHFLPLPDSASVLIFNACDTFILRIFYLMVPGCRCYCCGVLQFCLLRGVASAVSVIQTLKFLFQVLVKFSNLIICRLFDALRPSSIYTWHIGVFSIKVVLSSSNFPNCKRYVMCFDDDESVTAYVYRWEWRSSWVYEWSFN